MRTIASSFLLLPVPGEPSPGSIRVPWIPGWCLTLWMGILPLNVQAQITLDTAYLDMDVIGVKEGLSAGLVYEIAQDHKGYLWLATANGLNRYDGYRVRVFTHLQDDPVPATQ
ncbi:MAG: hypothetical protein IPJ06_12340 [Saprospiraceae bacterium]|nr:hypothetical protein [Saprospiraceae bacterium]